MDNLVLCLLLKENNQENKFLDFITIKQSAQMSKRLPCFGGLEAKPSNKSIIGAAPAFEFVLEERERDERSSNGETGALPFILVDNMSIEDALL